MAPAPGGLKTVKSFGLVMLTLLVLASILAFPVAALADASSSLYAFNYYYNDGSSDYYQGYVFAPTGMLFKGQYLYAQPEPMGGQKLTGYYYIYDAYSGYDVSYNAVEYICSYYDGDTGKTSYTLYGSAGQKTATASLYFANRCYTAESGYVYDPSVPDYDAFFGDADVCYGFNTYGTAADFLAAYIIDLPYWDQPSSYPGSCSEVAGAIVLSYWDRIGYSNLINTNWQNLWPNNCSYYQDSPASYVALIGTLTTEMQWDYGTYTTDIGPGLQSYAQMQGYAGFAYDYENVYGSRFSSWNACTAALAAGRPIIVDLEWAAGGHSAVGRGYWNDGEILVDFGWGLDYTNQKVDWLRPVYGWSYTEAMVYDYIDFYYR